MTTAQMISAKFNDDGTTFTSADGDDFESTAAQFAKRVEYARYDDEDHATPIAKGEAFWNDPIRYVFADGSALISCGDWWDIEADAPFRTSGGPGSGQ